MFKSNSLLLFSRNWYRSSRVINQFIRSPANGCQNGFHFDLNINNNLSINWVETSHRQMKTTVDVTKKSKLHHLSLHVLSMNWLFVYCRNGFLITERQYSICTFFYMIFLVKSTLYETHLGFCVWRDPSTEISRLVHFPISDFQSQHVVASNRSYAFDHLQLLIQVKRLHSARVNKLSWVNSIDFSSLCNSLLT